MSHPVNGKPIAMWSNEELREQLDLYVCRVDANEAVLVVAEAVSRLISASISSAPSPSKDKEPQDGKAL
jgi:hypothetical protein